MILVEHRGKLSGLVTVKDCLRYQFQVEAQGNLRDVSAEEELQDRLWDVIQRASAWFSDHLLGWTGGRIRLMNSPPRRSRQSQSGLSEAELLDGTEELAEDVELHPRL